MISAGYFEIGAQDLLPVVYLSQHGMCPLGRLLTAATGVENPRGRTVTLSTYSLPQDMIHTCRVFLAKLSCRASAGG